MSLHTHIIVITVAVIVDIGVIGLVIDARRFDALYESLKQIYMRNY